MDDPWSIWTIYDPNGPDMVQMGPDGSDMEELAETPRQIFSES